MKRLLDPLALSKLKIVKSSLAIIHSFAVLSKSDLFLYIYY